MTKPRAEKPLKRKLGLRGEVLLYIGILWMIYGFVVYQSPPAPGRLAALHELLPITWRALGWSITGIVAVVCAFRRWPGEDRWGFGALIIMPAERLLSWVLTPIFDALGWLPSELVGPPPLFCLGNAVVWGVICLLIYRVGASRQMLVIRQGENGEPGQVVAQGDVAELSPTEVDRINEEINPEEAS